MLYLGHSLGILFTYSLLIHSVVSVPVSPSDLEITILHTNDIHSHYDQFNALGLDCSEKEKQDHQCLGGMARLWTLVKQYRNKYPHTYLMDAGDQWQGTPFFTHYQGQLTAEVMNKFDYDLWAFGNHEFDLGTTPLVQMISKLKFPTLSANIKVGDRSKLKGKVMPYTVLNKYGHSIGVIGFITATLPDIAKLEDDIHVEDPVPAVQRAIDELRTKGVHRIIAVSHNGYQDDQRVAEHTEGLAAIVGGHSHTLLHVNSQLPEVKGPYPTRVMNKKGIPTLIVQVKKWGEYLGVLHLKWKGIEVVQVSGEPVHLTDTIQEDPSMANQIIEWRKPMDARLQHVIGSLQIDLPRIPCKSEACGLGGLVTAILWMGFHKAPKVDPQLPKVAMIQIGELRTNLEKGDITLASINTLLPYPNEVVMVKLSGVQLFQGIENTFTKINSVTQKKVLKFAQWRGVRVHVSGTPSQVQMVKVKNYSGQWVDVKTVPEVLLMTTKYVFEGGDSILPPLKGEQLVFQVPELLADLAEMYVTDSKMISKHQVEEPWLINQTN